MKKKETKIRKKNEIIRGTDDFSLYGKRCFNSLYFLIQSNLKTYPNLLKSKKIIVRLINLRNLMGLENVKDYINIIKKSIKELQQPIELNNYFHPIELKNYLWYSFSPLNDVSFDKNEKGEWIIEIELNRITKHLIDKNENYTILNILPYTNKMKTKYGMKLYEYLKSFENYRYIDITHNHLMKLFNLNINSYYKYFSKTKELLERQIKEIRTKTDLKNIKLITNKKEKYFRIIIDPNSKKELKDKNKLLNNLNKIINRF